MKLTVRFYRSYPMDITAEHPALGHLGEDEKVMDLDISKTVVAGMHLWNVGEPGGLDVTPDGPDWPITKLYSYYRDALDLTANKICPILSAARKADMDVVHVASSRYAHKYPQYAKTGEKHGHPDPDNTLPKPDLSWRAEFYEDHYGPNVDKPMLDVVKNKLRISKVVEPEPDDSVVISAYQFTRLLRNRQVNTIIYTGYATNECLLFAGGGMEQMRNHFRLIAVRAATVALEHNNTALQQTNRDAAIRMIEHSFGYTCTTADLLKSLGEAAKGT